MEQVTSTQDTKLTDTAQVPEAEPTSQSAKPDLFDFYDLFYNA